MKQAQGGPLLAVDGLTVSFDRVPVLTGMSLEVFEGQIAALVGPDGAGKTTLLNTISGLIRPDQGRILFLGEPLENLPVWEIVRRGVVYVPEQSGIFARMSVLENLEIGAYHNREQLKPRLAEVFQVFPELKELRHTPAGVLSGGQQRLVALGRGLMAGARLLLLDDPFLGLSPRLVRRLCDTFRQLIARGMTLLVASQYAHRILQVADSAYLVEEGRITLSGAGPEILRDQHLHQVLFAPDV
ncbi:MAG: ABC transporter ATP-binding protein [Deltaproteobacteria bacterium]|nr:ABC transporter ATP-binding protein [Deltaproteobacteria bacterium]